MASFVRDIEARPLPRLVSTFPGLLALPDAKYQLVVMVLRKKVKEASVEREPILARLRELALRLDPGRDGRRARRGVPGEAERVAPSRPTSRPSLRSTRSLLSSASRSSIHFWKSSGVWIVT